MRHLIAASICVFSVCAFAADQAVKPKQPIPQEQAERIALSKVPGGIIESAKLETEGKNSLRL